MSGIIPKFKMEEFVGELKKEKVQCKKILRICEEALEESLEPRSVWLQEKERYEKRINEIERSSEIFRKHIS